MSISRFELHDIVKVLTLQLPKLGVRLTSLRVDNRNFPDEETRDTLKPLLAIQPSLQSLAITPGRTAIRSILYSLGMGSSQRFFPRLSRYEVNLSPYLPVEPANQFRARYAIDPPPRPRLEPRLTIAPCFPPPKLRPNHCRPRPGKGPRR